jgi:hypothetical protein
LLWLPVRICRGGWQKRLGKWWKTSLYVNHAKSICKELLTKFNQGREDKPKLKASCEQVDSTQRRFGRSAFGSRSPKGFWRLREGTWIISFVFFYDNRCPEKIGLFWMKIGKKS